MTRHAAATPKLQKTLSLPLEKRQDASTRRQNASDDTGTQKKRCRHAPCSALFIPARVDQEYHSPKCRKDAWLDRSYTGPIADLRTSLEFLLGHCQRVLDRGDAVAVGSTYEETLRADIAAARKLLEKRDA